MRRPFVQIIVVVVSILIVAGIVYAGGARESGDLRDLPSFSTVHLSIPGRVELRQGGQISVHVSGSVSAIGAVDISVRDDVLYIEGRRWNLGRALDGLVFTVSAPVIDELFTSSSGDIHASRLDTAGLWLRSSSSGEIVIDRLTGDDLRVTMSSSGHITTSGAVRSLDLRISSSGDFRGRNLQTDDAVISLSSSGNAHVRVTGAITGRISSSGDLVYYGDPDSMRVTSSSSGNLRPGE